MPFVRTIGVRFRDCDQFGHVNNAVYLTYCEEARVGYTRLFWGDDAVSAARYVVGRATVDYRSPAHCGETLRVTATITAMRRTSFVMAYEIMAADGRLVATAETVQVMIDQARQVPRPLPPEFRARVGAFEGRAYPEAAA